MTGVLICLVSLCGLVADAAEEASVGWVAQVQVQRRPLLPALDRYRTLVGGAVPSSTPTQGTTGTAFLMGGHWVTAYHVVNGAERVAMLTADGRRVEARVKQVHPELDLAVLGLTTDAPGTEAGVACTDVSGPRAAVIWGYEGRSEPIGRPVQALGEVRRTIHDATRDWLEIEGTVVNGQSGAPLLDTVSGCVLGMVVAGHRDGGGFVLPVRHLGRPVLTYGASVLLGWSVAPDRVQDSAGPVMTIVEGVGRLWQPRTEMNAVRD
ncbi:MAG: S1 family peptidase [Myxococcota bacterium]